MKLADHVEKIRLLIDRAFRNRLGRMGIQEKVLVPVDNIPSEFHSDRAQVEKIFDTLRAETNNNSKEAFEKLVEEFTFTLFNRLAALKVMEAHTLHPEIVTRRAQHGGRSFAHRAWLEENPEERNSELEGVVQFLENQFHYLAAEINLFSIDYPYHLLPTAIELNQIIDAFNSVEEDRDVEENIWQSDDVMGWLYESYNNYKKIAHKESRAKTEYNKVSIQSQVYTPRWVVKFLVDNSLGKLYLEMFPHSEIKQKYQIANAPSDQVRDPKPLEEVKLIDPACGSANFLLYAFDLFYDLYLDQIENYGAGYDESKIPELIIHNNLHGIDLDDRAVQLAQLALYIKAKRRRRTARIEHFNVVSTDFFLPDYDEVKELFEADAPLKPELEHIVKELWADLQQAHKFGALLRIEEKFSLELHGLIEQFQGIQTRFFTEETLADYESFRENFFVNLQKAVAQHNQKFGSSFLSVKTADAITFLQLLTQEYDVAVANPPYTDSADYGAELKDFIEANYKKSYKFNSNLYAAFIKRNLELTNDKGYVALIHPHTFMFIKTFEDVRKFIIEKTHIDLLVDFGLDRVNLFGPGILLDATFYVLSKVKKETPGTYFNITSNLQEKHKKAKLFEAYNSKLNGQSHERLFDLDQSKLKIIEGYPFIYWISDGFREKFREKPFEDYLDIVQGIATANNERFLRFHWEVDSDSISNRNDDNRKWKNYSKGGPFNKWHGNNWLVINWENNGFEIKNYRYDNGKPRSAVRNEHFYLREGITYSSTSSKGPSFRHFQENQLFDSKGSCIFNNSKSLTSNTYVLGLLNTNLVTYIAQCLNATVETTQGDLKRIPFVNPSKEIEEVINTLAIRNTDIKKQLNSFQIVERNFEKNPLFAFLLTSLQERLLAYLNYENSLLTIVLLNEAIINQLVFKVYNLGNEDQQQVEATTGKSIGELPVWDEARNAYLELQIASAELQFVNDFIANLPTANFDEDQVQKIKSEFPTLYQSNNDLEEFCIRHQVNPINVWYWFKQSNVVPHGRAHEIALEFLADVTRIVLMEDEDGIVPLVGLPGEPALLDRLEQKCLSLGLSSAQFAQLDGLLGRPVKEYLEHYFFSRLSDHLNLFMYLPKTPFIWHLSSGEHQGFEAYIIIYKWTRDSLYKLKSKYITRREEALNYRLSQIADSNTAQAQTEKEKIRLQLQEIADFTRKVDELIAEGYNPKLDDGVGKNIAPLQKRGMLRANVLNSKQLEKYLNADW